MKQKLTTLLLTLSSSFVFAGETTIPTPCDTVKCEEVLLDYKVVLVHNRDRLLETTTFFIDMYYECACDILKQAALIADDKERIEILKWIDGNFKNEETKTFLIDCFKKRVMINPTPPILITPPVFTPIDTDPPVTQIGDVELTFE